MFAVLKNGERRDISNRRKATGKFDWVRDREPTEQDGIYFIWIAISITIQRI